MKEGEEGWLFSCDHDGCIRDFVVGSPTPTSMRRWRQGAYGLRDLGSGCSARFDESPRGPASDPWVNSGRFS